MRDKDISIILLESLPASFKYLITADERIYDGLCNGAFDVQNIKMQREKIPT